MGLKIKMTIDECLAFADEWIRGVTIHEGSQGWRVVCMLLAEEVRRLRAELTFERGEHSTWKIAHAKKCEQLVAIREQEPVIWIDGGDLREVSNGNDGHRLIYCEDQGRMVPLYADPVAPKVEQDDLLHDRPVAPSRAVLSKTVRNPSPPADKRDAEITDDMVWAGRAAYCRIMGGIEPDETDALVAAFKAMLSINAARSQE